MVDYLIVVVISALISALLLYVSARLAIRLRQVPFTHFRNKRALHRIDAATTNNHIEKFEVSAADRESIAGTIFWTNAISILAIAQSKKAPRHLQVLDQTIINSFSNATFSVQELKYG